LVIQNLQVKVLNQLKQVFPTKSRPHIYTKGGGWIDMTHFLFYVGVVAIQFKDEGHDNPMGATLNAK